MKIASVSMAANFKNNSASFKGAEKNVKPLITIPKNVPDDTVIMYGNWGGNLHIP